MEIIEDRDAFQTARAATVARTLKLARECMAAPGGDGLRPTAVDGISSELANHLLPHLESDLSLAAAIPGAPGASLSSEVSGERRELGSLIEELDRVLLDAVHRPRRVKRTLEAVIKVLERHLATERELWAALDRTGTSEQALSTLVREAEAAERLAERSLRFVWHPPVAATAAKALWWTSPGTRRVVVLGTEGALAVREGAADPDGKEAP